MNLKRFLLLVTGVCLIFTSCSTAVPESVQTQPVPEDVSYLDADISFLGPEGTYTQEACEVFFGGEGNLIPYATVAEAVDALVSGDADYAVIPQENTIGGPVADYIDIVLHTSDVSVTGEVVLTINQNLLVLPGASLDDITTVYSHRQGIAQGRQWLEENLPDAEIVEVSSTAEGARIVAQENDPSCAAIASAGCADVYGLEVLASAIQINGNNRTRFYVLSTDEPSETGGERISFAASGSSYDLPGLLSDIDECDAELITIHDRPLGTELGQYTYLIECAGLSYEDYLSVVQGSGLECRFLGSYRTVSN